jgi:hypothetical protein
VASTGFVLAGTGANNADAGDVAWSNPTRVTADDGSETSAVTEASAPATSQYLHATNFGFSIPSGATVNGITVRVQRRQQFSTNPYDHTIQLIVGGSRTGNNKAVGGSWPGSATNADYGSSSDLWGLTPTPAQINASNFGVAVRAEVASTFIAANVDAIWINVEYTESAAILEPEHGSFTLTGQAAGLYVGRELTAEQGSFSLTGQAADLRYFSLTAEQGGFTLSGQAAAFVVDYRLVAEQGSFALTGQDVTLSKGFVFENIEHGVFTLTGQDADFRRFVLSAEQGAFTLTGQTASLEYGYRLNAEHGTFALTGPDVDLRKGFTFSPEHGVFTLTGQNIYHLRAEHGAFTYTGRSANLEWGRLFQVEHGAYALTGGNAFFGRASSLKRDLISDATGYANVTATPSGYSGLIDDAPNYGDHLIKPGV